VHGDIRHTLIALDCLARNGAQCLHADIHLAHIGRIANAAVNHDAFPAVACSEGRHYVADYRATHRAGPVHHEHLAATVGLEGGLDVGVIFQGFQCDDLATEADAAAEISEYRGGHLKVLKMLVVEVGGFEGHGRYPLLV